MLLLLPHTSMASPVPGARGVNFGPFELDLCTGELKRDGRIEHLQGQPAQLLVVLVSRKGELVTREELRTKLWPEDTFVDFDHGLNNAVNRIREVLRDSAASPRYIQTVPRRGYRFVAQVEVPNRSQSITIPPVTEGALQPAPQAVLPGMRMPHWQMWTALLFIAVVAPIGVLWNRTSATPKVQSLAVLPFANFSGDSGQDYFADGVTDELITQLSKIRALKVVSRTSIMRYKGTKKHVPEIARELGVDALVEGSVIRDADQIRITVQLIDGQSDRHLWAESYHSEVGSVLRLQADVAQAISDQIRIAITPQERVQLSNSRSTINPQGYDAYLTGLYYWHRWDRGVDRAIPAFERATQLDPSFSPAYAHLALAYDVDGFFVKPGSIIPKERAAVLKALELDPNLAEAHAAAGTLALSYDWDLEAGQREARRAIDLDPNDVEAHLLLAYSLGMAGHLDQSIAEERRALELDPLSPNVVSELGWLYLMLRRYNDALAQYNHALELEPNHRIAQHQIAWVYTLEGKYSEAYAQYEKLEAKCCDPMLGYLYAVSGRRQDAMRVLTELQQGNTNNYSDAYGFAVVYAGLGDKDRAFAYLDKAYEDRSALLNHAPYENFFDSLRDDPRFPALIHRMGLPFVDPRKPPQQ